MKKVFLAAALMAAGLVTAMTSSAYDGSSDNMNELKPVTIAVFGDWPYNQNLLDNASLLINSVNTDKQVSMVMHVGDIHSGSMACTSADILPPISTSNPGWNQKIYYQFQQFKAPLVYTPGDNEWTDCHKSKELSSGAPLNELASLRSLFFPQPGITLGLNQRKVWSQATYYNPDYPTDAQYVENMMWMDSNVVFLTLNVPGSNNDTVPWTGIFSNPDAQNEEVTNRTNADLHWLESAFNLAMTKHASAVVIGIQADMWDPEAEANDQLAAYTPIVQKLADLSVSFGRPVMLLNGDSHVYEADQPLADPTSSTGVIYNTEPVPNLYRITVQGSTNAPAEWLRLTIDPRKPEVFSWVNVPYCADPTSSCQ